MKKDEILAKSRKEGKDEGKEYIESKGREFASIGVYATLLFVIIFDRINGIRDFSVYTLMFSYFASLSYGKYAATKQKVYLVTAIFCTAFSLILLTTHVLTTLAG